MQEATASLDAAKVISVDAAVIAFLPETDHTLTNKEEQRPAQKVFLGKQHFITLLPDGFGKGVGEHCSMRGLPQVDEAQPNFNPHTNRKLLTWQKKF